LTFISNNSAENLVYKPHIFWSGLTFCKPCLKIVFGPQTFMLNIRGVVLKEKWGRTGGRHTLDYIKINRDCYYESLHTSL